MNNNYAAASDFNDNKFNSTGAEHPVVVGHSYNANPQGLVLVDRGFVFTGRGLLSGHTVLW